MSEHAQGAAPNRVPYEPHRVAEQHDVLATLLAAFLDGELPPETAAQVEAHLAVCRRCAREVALQRQLAASLGQMGGPVASAALHTRIRQSIANAPVPASAVAPPVWSVAAWLGARWRWVAPAGGLLLLCWAGLMRREPTPAWPTDTAAGGVAAPVALGEAPLLDSLAVRWHALTDPLPGRDRDLDAVRRALGMAVVPIAHPALDLEAVWTTSAWGELVGALAYRHEGRLLVQFAVPDGVLLHAPGVLRDLDGVVVGTRADSLRLVAWRIPGGASVLMGPVTFEQLRAWQRSPTPTGRVGTSRQP